MAIKIRKHTDQKKIIRFKRKKRIRSVLSGTAEKPRMAVFKSNANMSVQLIDDEKGTTLLSASTLEKDQRGKVKNTIDGAKALGKLLADRAKQKKIETVVFDRAGYLYHGKIKALADAAREAGLKF
ncbi:MAG: 50S ribosomal protein L18 [Deltaproteobacteria bacterium]|nr:50S ribosomal protein L18 [Deltaproteobacteria bacterium]